MNPHPFIPALVKVALEAVFRKSQRAAGSTRQVALFDDLLHEKAANAFATMIFFHFHVHVSEWEVVVEQESPCGDDLAF